MTTTSSSPPVGGGRRHDREEAHLLLAILRGNWEDAERRSRARPVHPHCFVELARECDVHAWVHAVLEREDRFDLVGETAREGLAAARRTVRNNNMLLLAQAERSIDLLTRAGIRVVALKGLDFLHRFYGRFDERSFNDIDLLIPPESVETAFELLEDAGFELPEEPDRTHWLRSSFQMPIRTPGRVGARLEIHWSLGQDSRYRVDVERVLNAAVPAEIVGRSIHRLEDHDAAAHLLLHHLQHYFDRRLKWSLELRNIVAGADFDWRQVVDRLERWKGRAAVGLVLLHHEKLFPGTIGPEARRLLPASFWRRAVTWPLRSSHPIDYFRWCRRRWAQLYLAAVAFESPIDLPAYLRHRKTRDQQEQGPIPTPRSSSTNEGSGA